MGRQPLPLGQWGLIRVYPHLRDGAGKVTSYRARTLFRDLDGRTRSVARSGPSKSRAQATLKAALARRSSAGSRDLAGATRFSEFSVAAEMWVEDDRKHVDRVSRSPSTLETYEGHLRRHVLPGLGEVRLGEITVPLLDRFLELLATDSGVATSRSCRAVVSGVLSMAVRYGAVPTNPVRDAGPIASTRKRPPTSLTAKDGLELLALLAADARSVWN